MSNHLQTVLDFIKLFKDGNISVETKILQYGALTEVLKSLNEQTLNEIPEETLQCVFTLANNDVCNNSGAAKSALILIDEMCKCKWNSQVIKDFPDAYIYAAFKNTAEDIRETALDCMRHFVQNLIFQNNCDPEKLLLQVDTIEDRCTITKVFEEVCLEIPKHRSILFFYENVVPAMFDTPHTKVRGALTDFVRKCQKEFPTILLGSDKLQSLQTAITERYLAKIASLRKASDDYWDKLWCILLKCYDNVPYSQVAKILNEVLRVVEGGFRSLSLVQKERAYDCWKVLIDYFTAGNIEQLTNDKQLNLLMKPLKQIVLKKNNEETFPKRFELWMHLLTVVKQKSPLCVEGFLEFCFGPLKESEGNVGGVTEIYPEMRLPATRALLDIIGHYGHDKTTNCTKDLSNSTYITLDEPKITIETFASLKLLIVHSIGKCCRLMLKWMDKNTTKEVTKCLWGSVFTIITQLDAKDQEITLDKVCLLICDLLELCKVERNYSNCIVVPICELLVEKRFFHLDALMFNRILLFPVLHTFVGFNDFILINGRKSMLELYYLSCKNTDKVVWFKEAYNIFVSVKIEKNSRCLSQFWIESTDVLNNIYEFSDENSKKSIHNTAVSFMIWPVLYLPTIYKELQLKWGNAFATILKFYGNETSLSVLKNIQNNINKSSVVTSNISSLYPAFHPLFTTKPDRQFVNALLHLTSAMLAIPTLTVEGITFIMATIKLIATNFLEKNDNPFEDSDFQHLCQCYEYLLRLHRRFTILPQMKIFFHNLSDNHKENIPLCLRTAVNELKTNMDANIVKNAEILLLKFSKYSNKSLIKTDKIFLQTNHFQLYRGAKITRMAKETSNAPTTTNKASTTVVRLFGHNVVSAPPVALRGSQMGNNVTSVKRKAENIIPQIKTNPVRNDNEDANYVVINEEYKFDPLKLTEHQRDVMRHKSDIPALYEDLSRSQSNSQCLLDTQLENTKKAKQDEVDTTNTLTSQLRSQNDLDVTSVDLEKEKETGMDAVLIEINGNELTSKEHDQKNCSMPKAISEDLFNSEELPVSNLNEKNENCVVNKTIRQPTTTQEAQRDKRKSDSELSLANCNYSESIGLFKNKAVLALKPNTETNETSIKNDIHQLEVLHEMQNVENRLEVDDPCVENKLTDSLASTSKKRKMVDSSLLNQLSVPSEKRCKTSEQLNDNCSFIADLKIRNPSMEQIEAMITNISPSVNDDKSILTDVLNCKNSSDNKDNIPNENRQATEKRRNKFRQNELNRIKMDVVGGDSVVITDKKRTRRSVEVLSINHRSKSKSNNNSDVSKSPSDIDSNRKSKLRATVTIVDKLSKDKRITSPKSSKQFKNSVIPTSPVKNSSNIRHTSPKSRKSISDDSKIETNVSPNKQRKRKNSISKLENETNEVDKKLISTTRKRLTNVLSSFKRTNEVSNSQSPKVYRNQKKKSLNAEMKQEFTVTLINNMQSENSEDVIGSSQKSHVEIQPCQSSTNSAYLLSLKSEIDQVVTHLRKNDRHNSDSTKLVFTTIKSNEMKNNEPHKLIENAEIKNTNVVDNEKMCSPDALIDLASESSDINTCEMDTETLQIEPSTPNKLEGDIPTSPVSSDTPTRTTELLNNTINISPIRLLPEKNSEIALDLFKSDLCIINENTKLKLDEQAASNAPETSYQLLGSEGITRSAKLLGLVAHTPPQKINIKNKPKVVIPQSPAASERIIKMMKSYEVKLETDIVKEDVYKEDNDNAFKNFIQEHLLLKFEKALPSPLASPKFGILKRKAPDVDDEGISPPPKRRVNFSDPPTSCKKIYIVHENEYNKKYSCPTNSEPMENVPGIPTEDTKEDIKNQELSDIEVAVSEPETATESLVMKTQGSVDITNPQLLDGSQPIYSTLIHCNEDIHPILDTTVSPTFLQTVQEELYIKKLFTIGDLAKLSEVEINRLAFKSPKLVVVRNALNNINCTCRGIRTTTDIAEKEDANLVSITNPTTIDFDEEKPVAKDGNPQKTVKLQAGTKIDMPPDCALSTSSSSASNKVNIVSSIIVSPATEGLQDANTASFTQDCKASSQLQDNILNKVIQLNCPSPTQIDTSTIDQPATVVSNSNSLQFVDVSSQNINQTVTASASSKLLPTPKYRISKKIATPITIMVSNTTPVQTTPATSNIVKAGPSSSMEERQKLRLRIPDLLADFELIKKKILRQGLQESSLYETILEIAGPDIFISILQESQYLTVNHLVKNDNWSGVFNEIVENIGLRRVMYWLCRSSDVTPLLLVDVLLDQLSKAKEPNTSQIENLTGRIIDTASLCNIIRRVGMQPLIDSLCDVLENSKFTIAEFFQQCTFKLGPSIDDMIPSFKHLNVVHYKDKVVQRSDSDKNDLNTFAVKLLTIVDKTSLYKIFSQDDTDAESIVEYIPKGKKEKVMFGLLNELSQSKVDDAAFSILNKVSEDKQNELVLIKLENMSVEKRNELVVTQVQNMSVEKQNELILAQIKNMPVEKRKGLVLTQVKNLSVVKRKELVLTQIENMSAEKQNELILTQIENMPVEKRNELILTQVENMSVDKRKELVLTQVENMSVENQMEVAFSVFDKIKNDDLYSQFSVYFHGRLKKV